MKDLFLQLPILTKKISRVRGCLVVLDFDGTLSPIAATPNQAILPIKTKNILKKLLSVAPIAVVSGRSLKDITKKINLPGIIYSGNHGLEWNVAPTKKAISIPSKTRPVLKTLAAKLSKICESTPGTLLENKIQTLSVHYRQVPPKKIPEFLKTTKEIFIKYNDKKYLSLHNGKMVLEIRPNINWNKGKLVRSLQKNFDKNFLPIFIGDDSTDEDVFKILKNGITVKVGPGSSRAKYFCHRPADVVIFLEWLYQNLYKSNNH